MTLPSKASDKLHSWKNLCFSTHVIYSFHLLILLVVLPQEKDNGGEKNTRQIGNMKRTTAFKGLLLPLGAAYVSPVCKLVGAGRNTAVLSVPFEYSPGTPESPAGEVSSFGESCSQTLFKSDTSVLNTAHG